MMPKTKSHNTIGAAGLSALCLQLHGLLQAGISPAESFSILLDDAAAPAEQTLLTAITKALDEGALLSGALAQTASFPPYLVRMIAVGERTGQLDSTLAALADYYEREHFISASVRSAVVYPAIMAGTMLVLLTILTAFVLPVFADIFASLGLTLSSTATALMHAGQFLAASAGWVLGALIVLGVMLYVFWRRGKLTLFQNTALSGQIAASRFAAALALLLGSGFDTEAALTEAAALTGRASIGDAAAQMLKRMQAGATLSQTLADSGLFSAFYLRMLRVGEHTGRTDKMLSEIAARMTADSGARIDRLIARIEPTIVIALSCTAGLILLSVMLPLLGVLSAIG